MADDNNNIDEMKRATSESPVPSFTLQITKHDAEKFLQASRELQATLQRVDDTGAAEHKNTSLSSAAVGSSNGNAPVLKQKQPLHELLFDAALQCEHPLITAILEREAAFRIPEQEAKAAFLLFHESDKTAKLRHFFRVLSSSSSSPSGGDNNNEDNKLDRSGVLSLFRSVLLSLSCCVHTPEQHHIKNVVVEGKPDSRSPEEHQRPTKRLKHGDETASTKPLSETDDGALPEIQDAAQSGSFDSSIATLRHEDEKDNIVSGNLRREIEEVAAYAADEVIGFARALDKENNEVDLVMFGDWYNKTGRTIVPWLELLQPSKWKSQERSISKENATAAEQEQSESPSSLLTEEPDSRAVLSFDFSDPSSPSRVVVHISEDNITALRFFVQRTGLVNLPPEDICRVLLQLSPQGKTISREVFQREYYRMIPPDVFGTLSSAEKEAFQEALLGYFTAFEDSGDPSLRNTEVDLKELALGFCFFCAGNKSTKLALGFDLLDTAHTEFLTDSQLLRFLQAYLSMLVATSLLIPIPKWQSHRAISLERRKLMHAAVHRGAKWTLGHFIKDVASTIRDGRYSFDTFAQWYSLSGYNVAPWLELLDLHKLFALVSSEIPSPMRLPSFDHQQERTQRQGPTATASVMQRSTRPRDRVSSLRRHHSSRRRGRPEILFTFPLANQRSLVVLKDDAVYVRDVVEQLGLLSVRPETLWDALASTVKKRRSKPKQPEDAPEYVDMGTFVQCVQEICPKLSRNRSNPGDSIVQSAAAEELLSNFFQCFDLNQTDRVAVDELMGGLSLLCGGKKSTKLSFAFSIFDTRPGAHDKKRKQSFVHSLSGEDLFLFLRSILIVTFSCCRQSLDMSDEQVGRCIADTANMICNDVMRYQWEAKQLDRLDFDEFGQWYNDGGFERAPWLELLDLGKWVLVDDYSSLETKTAPPQHPAPPSSALSPHPSGLTPRPSGLTPRPSGLTPRARDHVRFPDDPAVPPPPPEDALDTSFFDENAIMPMDSVCTSSYALACVFILFIMITQRLCFTLFSPPDGRYGHDSNAAVNGQRNRCFEPKTD